MSPIQYKHIYENVTANVRPSRLIGIHIKTSFVASGVAFYRLADMRISTYKHATHRKRERQVRDVHWVYYTLYKLSWENLTIHFSNFTRCNLFFEIKINNKKKTVDTKLIDNDNQCKSKIFFDIFFINIFFFALIVSKKN